jgi:hypothetical protein
VKVRCDEHVSVEIVDAINKIARPQGFEVSSVYGAGQSGDPDVSWLRAFANDGGKAIITADTDFIKRPHQVMSVQDTGIVVIHLPPKWANAKGVLQAAHMLAWWSRIEKKLISAKPKECWRPDWNISEEGDLKFVRIDFEEARKKLKKSERPARL